MSFLDRLAYDAETGEHTDSGIRYMMIRPDAFMGILHELPEEDRPRVLEAMARSITTQGAKSAQAYQKMGASDSTALLNVIAGTAPELGWGIWTFSEPDADGFTLQVRNSPFAAGYGAAPWPVCAPIRGMLVAVGQMVLGQAVSVSETSCAACGSEICQFAISAQSGAVA
ncbi:V4R domain-containing protein [uncultured Hoeflea sp.]|uniref:V4R domain-containing protein n=1 Tax=uncultured Hoeflea sp. TaxID=538666 RepID=UPI0030DC53B8|tara:strand:- start:2115 stop:2624 length:510 start_codon:yes stop_codon:yes gene_type:complete